MNNGLGNLVLLTALAVVPLVALMLTSFVKVSVVLSLLRNALGAPDAPSGLVVTGLSLILTLFVMAPVAIDMASAAGSTTNPSYGTNVRSPAGGSGSKDVTPPAGSDSADAKSGGGTRPVDAESGAGGAGPADAKSGGGVVGPGGAKSGGGAGPVEAKSGGGSASLDSKPAAGGAGPANARQSSTTLADAKSSTGGDAKPPGTGVVDIDRAIRQLVPPQYQAQLDGAARAIGPLRAFLGRHASARDRETFISLARRMGRTVTGDELWVLAPAFVASELREAFAIAVLIFVPFLVIDLVVGLGLAALGLSTTSPQVIALPFKLLLFVSVDGWRLLLDGLMRGYL